MSDELLVRSEGSARFLTLNRPRAIHALTLGMCEQMIAALLGWIDDDAVSAVIIEHGEGRGFCSGGDISLLRRSAIEDGGATGRAFFRTEYQLNHLLFTYPKPLVAFMDGITMGGGVGISQPARFRVATENTSYAMPEPRIGRFPEVGGGWYLSRLPGRIGQFLALTGAQLDGAECLWAGLASDYLPADSLGEAKARIAAGEHIAGVLTGLSIQPPLAKLEAEAPAIARHFASDRLEDILSSLAADPGEWAQAQLAILRRKSPQTCKVALRQLAEAAELDDFADEMVREFRIASRVLTRPDFAEGVRAVIVDKTHDPRWDPPTPEAVTGELLDTIFAALPADEEWRPLR